MASRRVKALEDDSYSEGGQHSTSGNDQRLELRISTNFQTPLKLFAITKLQREIWQTGFYQRTGGSTKFPEFVAEESIVRNFRIYFVPAKRQSFVMEDFHCQLSLSDQSEQ